MKKNIGFVNLDSSLASWLREKLKTAPVQVKGAEELLEAITELSKGDCRSVMLEMGEDTGASFHDTISCGELRISSTARKVIRGEKEIVLTPKEFDILLFLARNRGEVFTKEQIYGAVWDDKYLMDDSNIMAFIRKLRKKIEPNPDAPKYILTIWGIGYKFNDQL